MTTCACPPQRAASRRADRHGTASVGALDPCRPPLPVAMLPPQLGLSVLRGSVLDGAPHPPPFYRDRVKCTVTRVANLTLTATAGVHAWRFRLAQPQTRRHEHGDAEHGIVFARLLADAQTTTATARVLWEIPGSPFEWLERQTPLPLGQTVRFAAWQSPYPASVTVEIVLSHSGPPTTLHLRLDLLARRPGLAFRRGHLLRDDTTFHDQPPPAETYDPEPELLPAGPAWPQRPPCAPRPPRADADHACNLGDLPGTPRTIHTCIPDPDVLDWTPEPGVDEPDPEVAAGVAADFDLRTLTYDRAANPNAPYGRGGSGRGRVGLLGDRGFDAARDAPELMANTNSALVEHLGRCAPFTQIWHQVTGDLERDRMPLSDLDDIILPGVTGYPGESRRRDQRMTDLAASIDGDPNAWTWTVAAPWLDTRYRVTWYLTELVNLVHATRQHIPVALPVGREGQDRPELIRIPNAHASIRGERGWSLRLRRSGGSCRDVRSVLQRPAYDPSFLHTGQLPVNFDIATRTANAKAFPHTRRIRLQGGYIATHLRPAQALYTVARQIAMAAAQVEGAQRETLIGHANNVYRAYLGTLLPVAKTLIHELAHFDHASHCKSGCAQERIAARWVRNVGEALRPGWALTTAWDAGATFVTLPLSDWEGDVTGSGGDVCFDPAGGTRDFTAAVLCDSDHFRPVTASRASKCRDGTYWFWNIGKFGEAESGGNQLVGGVRQFKGRHPRNAGQGDMASRGFRRACTDDGRMPRQD